ncbi:hypothetical protein AVEN_251516-1 [Araneus ventricosus]|uniref:Uncharacterized protein n=1 Tax=Araneus ventricosus TaxID=182803 RepID=A0A4Y2Q359_ARAVE|nr:hypothetical protein AVEN_251516-1 [Araneus ventricosus]
MSTGQTSGHRFCQISSEASSQLRLRTNLRQSQNSHALYNSASQTDSGHLPTSGHFWTTSVERLGKQSAYLLNSGDSLNY